MTHASERRQLAECRRYNLRGHLLAVLKLELRGANLAGSIGSSSRMTYWPEGGPSNFENSPRDRARSRGFPIGMEVHRFRVM
jgi:hypothetical protein